MIDFIALTLTGTFPAIGKKVSVSHRPNNIGKSYTRDRYRLFENGADFVAQVSGTLNSLRLEFCPAKVLQGHNGIGSNDLRSVVIYSVRLILDRLKVKRTQDIENNLKHGDYVLHEVHIAELHRMPHSMIGTMCDHIRKFAPAELQVTPIHPGVGIRLWPNSRSRQVLIYDKYHHFMDKTFKHKKILLAGTHDWTKMGLSFHFENLLEYLRKGVRIECRLKSQYLRSHKLNMGKNWSEERGRNEYLTMLADIPLSGICPRFDVNAILKKLSAPQKIVFSVWLAGCDPHIVCSSKASFFRHRKVILQKIGYDVSRPGISLPEGITWSNLVSIKSIVDPPRWSKHSMLFFEPRFFLATQHLRSVS
jgi:hypothetical protein